MSDLISALRKRGLLPPHDGLTEDRPMSTAFALLKTIESGSSDRLPRLVFADWIQERGHESDAARLRAPRLLHRYPLGFLSADAWCEVIADIGEVWFESIDLTKRYQYGRLTDRGLSHLAVVRAPRLRHLDVSRADVSEDAVRWLVRADGLSALECLVLDGIPLPDEKWTRADRARRWQLAPVVHGYDRCDPRHGGCDCVECTGILCRAEAEPYDLPLCDRPDRDATGTGHPGRSRRTWWGGYQVSHLQKRRKASE